MPIRVLVVDDSAVVRRAVASILEAEAGIEAVATAADGMIGLRKIADRRPDVVTLDVEMPGLDGLDTLREIRRQWPDLPVIMYSSITRRGAHSTLEALSIGAVDYATKPERAINRDEVARQVRTSLLPLILLWGARSSTARTPAPSLAPSRPQLRETAGEPPARPSRGPKLVVIGVSTGGPDALAQLVPALPESFPLPILIVQHMPPVFTEMLAARLDHRSALTVREAAGGEMAEPGHVYIAPGGRHLEVHPVAAGLGLVVTDAPPENSCRPSADVLFRTAAAATMGRLLAVVLTGMGQDGRFGSRDVVAAGGTVIAQDEPTSVVWGMPGFVAGDGTASSVLPLEQIAPTLVGLVSPMTVGAIR